MFSDKQTIVIGERDGIAGPAIQACVEAAGGHTVYVSTACFV